MTSKLTLNAVVFLILTVFTVSVAIYFNNPLLVFTAIFLVTTNVVLFVWAHSAVRHLAITRIPPKLAVAGQRIEVGIELVNAHRSTRYGLLGFDLHGGLTPGQEYSPVAFLVAQQGVPVFSRYALVPARRGIYSLGPLYMYGGDPFGFYKCWHKIETTTELTVLPRPLAYRALQMESISQVTREELATIPVPGTSTEFLGVRDYVAGEPLRHVHWRTSARMGRLISRQYERNVAASVSALLLCDEGMLVGTTIESPLEYSITMIASMANATASQQFHFSYLSIQGDKHDRLSGIGPRFYQELAVRLARLKAGGQVRWDTAPRLIANLLPSDSSLIVFTSSLGAESATVLSRLAVHFRQMVVVTFNRESFERGKQNTTSGRISLGNGYRIVEIGFQDDLKRALGTIFAASFSSGQSQSSSRGMPSR
jgi:uncharacterized protein (DUF58 family)